MKKKTEKSKHHSLNSHHLALNSGNSYLLQLYTIICYILNSIHDHTNGHISAFPLSEDEERDLRYSRNQDSCFLWSEGELETPLAWLRLQEVSKTQVVCCHFLHLVRQKWRVGWGGAKMGKMCRCKCWVSKMTFWFFWDQHVPVDHEPNHFLIQQSPKVAKKNGASGFQQTSSKSKLQAGQERQG